ncbi:hypothetical protein FEM48_Zijuj03G0188100 [Ziziphus jujuba var. spinosa]|uniref:Uncharacterized protein n=1 Tax=Ziziphus jujuba var. spinosa TaxID=714518 RepID=A0A978VS05_ZIZJJ|nr:hypothetical protein FEM48_Zijuj03G0188100 [Ziziphus jujuba var. spinosa]
MSTLEAKGCLGFGGGSEKEPPPPKKKKKKKGGQGQVPLSTLWLLPLPVDPKKIESSELEEKIPANKLECSVIVAMHFIGSV